MSEQQAAEIVLLLRAATASRVEQSTLDYFSVALLPLDYDLGLAAASVGTITWRRFPSWAEYKESYRAQQRIAGPVGEQRDTSTRGDEELMEKRGVAAPEWVWVWSWARLMRQPRNLRMFPQQESQTDPTTVMTTDEYEELRKEWKEAGSPKSANPLLMSR